MILGALGGLVAGAYLGAKIEGHSCACDDPGLKGAMIGAPLGAAAGGILAAEFWRGHPDMRLFAESRQPEVAGGATR